MITSTLTRKRILIVVAAAAMTAILVGGSPPAHAQPTASLGLPPPGGAKPLFSGCNNVSLTFPDGTASQTVVQAVTPPGAVESVWRHSGALNKFEGFSPAYPQASDLVAVSFLDAVWLCMSTAPGGTAPAPGPAAPPPPAPAGPTATPTPPSPPPPPPPPGPTATPTPTPAMPPGGGSWGILTADVAVTDIYPDNWPNGKLIARVMNFGPDTVSGVTLELGCAYTRTEYVAGGSKSTIAVAPALISPTLAKGQTAEFDVHIPVQGTKYWYDVTCNVKVPFKDPNTTNNSYSEVFPPPP